MSASSLPPPWASGDIAGPAWPGVCLFTTGRQGGVSRAPFDSFNVGTHVGDAPDAVAANRQALRHRLPGEPLWLNQVHGIAVVDADAIPDDAARAVPTADAAFTRRGNQVLAIMTADCLPVVIAAADGSIVGAAHAGWRGLAGGVLDALLAAMQAAAPEVDRWRAWIGPAIGPRAFEVGDDVPRAFAASLASASAIAAFRPHPGVPGKWLADLPRLAAQRLQHAGVHTVEQSGVCTVTQAEQCFSYRRDGQCGRMVTLVWRTHP